MSSHGDAIEAGDVDGMSLIAALLAAVFVAVSGPPATPPSEVGGLIGPGPPPAWVEAGRRSVWTTYGSYCWSTPGKSAARVDMIPPTTRPDLARLPAKAGAPVRLHLGFAPRSVRVYLLSGPSHTPRWRGARSAGGRASASSTRGDRREGLGLVLVRLVSAAA